MSSRSEYWRCWRSIIVNRNPFYLLSAFLMLVGCYIVTVALDPSPEHLDKMLIVLGVLNLYEILVVALGLFLVVTGRASRDGRLLLVLAIVFLVDGAYLNTQCVAADPVSGGMLSIAVLVLGLVKLAAMLYFLRLRYSIGQMIFIALQIIILFVMPGVFAWILINRCAYDGGLPVSALYSAWWLLGLLFAAFPRGHTVVVGSPGESMADSARATIGRMLVRLPFISIIVHLVLANGLYDRSFHVCNLAPILLGLAAYMARIDTGPGMPARSPIRPLLLVAGAILLALPTPKELFIELSCAREVFLTPFRLTLFGASVTYAFCFLVYRRAYFAVLSPVCLLAGLASHSPRALGTSTRLLFKRIARTCPDTPLQWGVMAMVAAFIFLVLGAAVSLFWRRGEEEDPGEFGSCRI